jgi:hypothetical protein
MTSMPIIEQILRGGRITNAQDPDMAKGIHDGVKQSVFFNIQVAEDIAEAQLQRTKVLVDKNTGRLQPPYPEMFMEWSYLGSPFGCFLNEDRDNTLPISFIDGAKANLIATFILPTRDKKHLIACPHHRIISLDKASQFQEWGIVGDANDEDITMTNYLLTTVVTALALINCRNVTTQPTGRIGIGRNGTQKRRNETTPEIRYQTIILPGGGTQSDDKGGHRATALHRVRGHFKTFTTDKPLLGKHTGTYWWGWQVRGNSDHGTIISDYQLNEVPA